MVKPDNEGAMIVVGLFQGMMDMLGLKKMPDEEEIDEKYYDSLNGQDRKDVSK